MQTGGWRCAKPQLITHNAKSGTKSSGQDGAAPLDEKCIAIRHGAPERPQGQELDWRLLVFGARDRGIYHIASGRPRQSKSTQPTTSRALLLMLLLCGREDEN